MDKAHGETPQFGPAIPTYVSTYSVSGSPRLKGSPKLFMSPPFKTLLLKVTPIECATTSILEAPVYSRTASINFLKYIRYSF